MKSHLDVQMKMHVTTTRMQLKMMEVVLMRLIVQVSVVVMRRLMTVVSVMVMDLAVRFILSLR